MRLEPVFAGHDQVGRDVRDIQGSLVGGHPSGDAVIERQAADRIVRFESIVGEGAQIEMTPCFVSHPERDQGRGHELRSGARDRVKDVSDIERRGYDLVQACERLRAGGLLTRVSKQSVSFDRKRGLVGEAREQRDLIRAEEPPLLREDVQDADDPLVRSQRHAQEAVEAELDDRLLVARVIAGVHGQIGNGDRLASHHDGSAQALAHGDSGASHDGGGRLRASADHQLVPVTQPKSRAFDGEQGRRRIHDQVEDLGQPPARDTGTDTMRQGRAGPS